MILSSLPTIGSAESHLALQSRWRRRCLMF